MSVSVATAAGSSGAVASWPALRGVPAGAVGRVLAAFAPSASVIEVCSADDLAGPPTRNLPTRDLGPDDGVAGQGGEADLLVVEHGCRPAMGGFGPASAGRLAAGGLLAVLTHLDRRDDRTGDPAGSVVAAAQHADLLYLQHIVLTTDVLTTDVLTTDVLTTDVLTTDVLTTDVLTTDVLTTDVLTTVAAPPTEPAPQKRIGSSDEPEPQPGPELVPESEPQCGYCGVRPAVVNVLLFAQPAAARPTVRVELAPAVSSAIHPAGGGAAHTPAAAASGPGQTESGAVARVRAEAPHPELTDGGPEVQR